MAKQPQTSIKTKMPTHYNVESVKYQFCKMVKAKNANSLKY